MDQGQRVNAACKGGESKPCRDHDGSQREGNRDTKTIHQAPHQKIARAKPHHRHRVGQGRSRAQRSKFRLNRRHDHDNGPHAHIGNHRNRQGDGEPTPRIGAIMNIALHGSDLFTSRKSHAIAIPKIAPTKVASARHSWRDGQITREEKDDAICP